MGSMFAIQVKTGSETKVKEMLKYVLESASYDLVKGIYANETHTKIISENDHENGFTFVSILFALVAISITIPLLMYLLELSIYQDNHEDISVFHFFHFFQDDFFLTQEYKIVDNQLYLIFI